MLFQSMDESSSLKDISISPVTWPEKKALTWIFLDLYLSYRAFFHGTFAIFHHFSTKGSTK